MNQHQQRHITLHPAIEHRYITTASGVNIGPPGVFGTADVCLSDIRGALAKTCRFNGHTRGHYSVAEHSVLVSLIAEAHDDEEAMIPALFHDAHEAYIGDLASPQKDMVQGWRQFEARMEFVVREALDLPDPDDDVWVRVREYDTQILHREVAVLFTLWPDWYDPKIDALVPGRVQPIGLEWPEADAYFRARMHDLGWGLGGNA